MYFQPRNTYFYRLHDASIIHTQSIALRDFFEEQGTIFALQRRARGFDDLDSGQPPDPPTGLSALENSARAHITGLFNGLIWQAFHRGDTAGASRHLWRALKEFPNSPAIWRTAFIMLYKVLFRRT